MLVYFTSGTTSHPKLVEHTHRSYPVGHLSTMYFIGLSPGDVHLNISSPGWAKHAWSSFFAPWIAESTIVAYNYARFDPARFLGVLQHVAVTSLCAPPTVWRMLIQAHLGEKPRALREAMGAGEPLNPEVIARVRDGWGLTIRDGFGQTETTALIGNTPGARVKPGSMGRPLPGVPVEIVDPITGGAAHIEPPPRAHPHRLPTGPSPPHRRRRVRAPDGSGAGGARTTIDADQASRVLGISGKGTAVRLGSLVLTRGRTGGQPGGGIALTGGAALTLTDSDVTANDTRNPGDDSKPMETTCVAEHTRGRSGALCRADGRGLRHGGLAGLLPDPAARRPSDRARRPCRG